MYSKQRIEDDLFIKWSKWIQENHPEHGFMYDGIVDPDEWCKANKQILFLLKDYHEKDISRRISTFKTLDLDKIDGKGVFDLREYLKSDKKHWRVWNNVSRWAYGLEHNLIPYDKKVDEKGNSENRKKVIASIAVVDIKKSPGVKSCNRKDLDKYFKDYPFIYDLLSEQLKLYGKLDYIVCCGDGVYDHFQRLSSCVRFCGNPYQHREKKFLITSDGTVVISVRHPLLMGKGTSGKKGEYEKIMKIVRRAEDYKKMSL